VAELTRGDVLAGKYELVEVLGRGGFGEVWGARTRDGKSSVAVKVLHPDASARPELLARFQREVRAAARVKSPYVYPVLDAHTDGPAPHYLVSEWYRGETLMARLAREQYLSFGELGPILEDVLEGLVATHKAGVVHRDVKPANIFLRKGSRGRVRAVLLDLGVAKIRGEAPMLDGDVLTAKGATLGSLSFMAPEQVEGSDKVDERSDLYALGVLAFRSLVGKLPHNPGTAAELLALKLDTDVPSLSAATEVEWPAGIERFLVRLLARKRDARFPSAEHALSAVRELRRLHPSLDIIPAIEAGHSELDVPVTGTAPGGRGR
jgi:eukaryotic-like serine/threonine-protein kinase